MRWAVLSDIHGNWPALQAVGKHLHTQRIDRVVFTGDLTVYYPFPNECIEWLYTEMGKQKWEEYALKGNNDKALLEGTWKSDPTRKTVVWWSTKWADEILSDINRDRLNNLRAQKIVQEGVFTAVHGTVGDPLGEIYYMIDDFVIKESLQALTTPLGIFGHTHRPIVHSGKPQKFPLPFSIETQYPEYSVLDGAKVYRYHYQEKLEQGNRLLVCPGSVGQPRDTDNWASYLIIDDVEKVFIFFRVDYDRDIVINELNKYKEENPIVVEKLAERLRRGV